MIKKLVNKILNVFRLQILRVSKPPLPAQPPAATLIQPANKVDYLEALSREPLNAELHRQYAIQASSSGRHYLALAELKTAEYLGADRRQIERYVTAFREALPDLKSMNHNQYCQYGTLTTSLAMVFVNYFAAKSGLHNDWKN